MFRSGTVPNHSVGSARGVRCPDWRLLVALVVAVILAPLALADSAGAASTTVTSAPIDGYDQKNLKTLVADGKVYQVANSDNDWFPVEAGYFLSLQFPQVPASSIIESVQVVVEHHAEFETTPASTLWEVGGGSLTAPSVALSTRPALLIGPSAEARVTWDVTSVIDTAAEVNGLRVVVRNQATNGKKVLLDQVSLVVRYSDQPPAPTAPTITSTPSTSGAVNQAYSYQAAATGTTPITWSLPTAPPGMAVSAAGLISWTPAAAGSFAVTLQAQNATGATAQSWTIVVSAAPLQTTTITLAPTDGYDQKNVKTLVNDGKLYLVASSDNQWFQVEAGYFVSFAFQGTVPAGATITSARISIEHHEEAGISPSAVTLQAGGGALTNPTALLSQTTPLLIGSTAERTVEWDVTSTINSPARANDLKLVVRNTATNGKKANVDRVFATVAYAVPPTAPTITSTPLTVGYVNTVYSYQSQFTGTPPITWSLSAAPAGMTVSQTGLVTWTPNAVGSFPVTLRASNAIGATSQSWTIAVADAPPPEVVYAAGDIASCASSGDEATAALLDANPGGTVLTLGDNVYQDGTATEFTNCYQPSWGRHKARTRPSPGNHDYNTLGASGYFGYFGTAAGPLNRGYYSFDLGAWHVISLNTEQDFGASGAQMAWLRADLAATTSPCVLAYWHKPRFTTANYNDFTEFQPFWDALATAGAEIVLSGHDHVYERYQPMNASGALDPARGVRSFVVGTGGVGHYTLRPDARRQAENQTAFGVLKLTLSAGGYAWNFLPVAGQTYTDSGSASCR
jgi:Calcineurin-like phosphoesterase